MVAFDLAALASALLLLSASSAPSSAKLDFSSLPSSDSFLPSFDSAEFTHRLSFEILDDECKLLMGGKNDVNGIDTARSAKGLNELVLL